MKSIKYKELGLLKDLKEYRSWIAMKSRCYAKSLKDDGNYRKNNIQVCDDWIDNFYKFYLDMGKAPSIKYTIDRIDNNKNYCKSNCRWATMSEQSKNRGDFNILIKYNNEEMVLKDWARKLDIKYATLYNRVITRKIPFNEAIKLPLRTKRFFYDDKYWSLKELSSKFNVKYSLLNDRISSLGWSIEKALFTK